MEDIVRAIRLDTGDSEQRLKDLADGVSSLKEELNRLNSNTGEYISKLKELEDAQERINALLSNGASTVKELAEAYRSLDASVKGIKDVITSIPGTDINIGTGEIDGAINTLNRLEEAIKGIKEAVEALPTVELDIDASESVEDVTEQINNLKSDIEDIEGKEIEVEVNVDDDGIAQVQDEIDSLEGKEVEVEVVTNDSNLADVQAEIDSLGDKSVEIDVDVNGEDKVQDIIDTVEDLQNQIENLDSDELEKLKGIINDFGDEGTRSFKSLNEELARLRKEWENAESDIARSQISQRIKELNDELNRMKTEGGNMTVKDLKENIKQLRDELTNLNPETAEYKQTIDQLISSEMRLTTIMRAGKNEMTAALGSYNSLVNEMSALKKVWREVTDEAERSKIATRINEINSELKRMDATLGNHQRNVGNYTSALENVSGSVVSWRRELKDLKIAMQSLDPATKEYQEAFKRAAELTHNLAYQQEILKYGSADLGDQLANLAGIATDITGGISAVNALMGLLGNGDSDIQKAMLTATRFVQLVQGLSKIDNLIKRLGGLMQVFKGVGQTMDTAKGSAAGLETQMHGLGGAENVAAGGAQTLAGSVNEAAGNVIKASEDMARMAGETRNLETETEKLISRQNTLYNSLAVLQIQYEKGAISEAEYARQSALLNSELASLEGRIVDNVIKISELTEVQYESAAAMVFGGKEIAKAAASYSSASNRINFLNGEIDKLNAKINEENQNIRTNNLLLAVGAKTQEEYDASVAGSEARISQYTAKVEEYNQKIREQEAIETRLIEENGEVVASLAPMVDEVTELVLVTGEGTNATERYTSELKRLKAQADQTKASLGLETAAVNNNTKAETKNISTLKGFIKQKRLERAERKMAEAAKKAETAATNAATGAVNGETTATVTYTGVAKAASIATNLFTGALKLLKAAIIATGIGLLFTGISELIHLLPSAISAFKELVGWVDKAKETNEVFKKSNDQLMASIASETRIMEYEAAIMSARGKTEQEIIKKKMDYIKALIEQTKQERANQMAVYNSLSVKEREKKKYKEFRDEIDRTIQKLNELERTYDDLTKDLVIANITAEEDLTKTNEEAANSLKSTIQQENDAYNKLVQEFQAKGMDITTITKAHWKKIGDIIDSNTKSILDRAKASNQTELQNLEDKYKEELAILKRYGKNTDNLTREYVANRQKILDREAADELKREHELLKGLITEYDILQAAGAKSTQEYKERLEMDYQLDMDFYAKMKERYQAVMDDETTTVNARIEAEKNFNDTLKVENERTTKFLLDNIRRRTAELDDEISEIEKWKDAQLDAYDQSARAMKNYAHEETGFTTTMKTVFEFDQGSYKEQEEAIKNRYQIIEDALRKEEQAYIKAMMSEENTQEEKTEAQRKLTELRKKMMDSEEDKVIELAELTKDKNREIADAILDVAGSIGDVFGSLADAISAHTEAMIKEGKITDKEAEKQFKKVKNLQIAQATIQTISGAIGAYMGASSTIPPPLGQAVGAASAAAVLASGAAQIEQLKHVNVGDSSSSSLKNVSVTPTYTEYRPETVNTVTGADEELKLRNALRQTPIYVTVTDIDQGLQGNRVKVRESSF